jgi:hypothetical protein
MTGALYTAQNPASAMEAANKQWVEGLITGSTAGVSSFNTRLGAVTLLSADVTTALSYTPANAAGQAFTGNVSTPILTANKVQAPVVIVGPVTPAETVGGALTIDASLKQNVVWTMNANITLTITNSVLGQLIRVGLFGTAGRTITWPPNTVWPMPVTTPPIIDSGPMKYCLVVLESVNGSWLANASVY